MSIFDQYNFELPRAIMVGLKPIKELPPPFLVRVETEVYRGRKYFVPTDWKDRFQSTKVVHVFDRHIVIICWDTTDYESLGYPPLDPSIIWKFVFNIDDAPKLIAFKMVMNGRFKLWPEENNFQQVVWRLLNRPLWERIQYVEEIIKNKKIMNIAKKDRSKRLAEVM